MINWRQSQGLTLLELLVTLTLFTLLVSFATASYEPIIASNRTRTVLSELKHLVRLTQSEAIKRGQRMVLCSTVDGTSCSDQWHARLILFPDPEGDQKATSAAAVVLDQRVVSIGGRLTYNRKALLFGPLGRTLGTNGTFTYCWKNKQTSAHAMVISRLGRLRYATDHDGDGVREKVPGEALACPS